jgi:hypothetical protein
MDESGTAATVARVFNVVGFAGSLRRGSYNRALLSAATELAPSALHIVIHELDGIPLYNGDIEAAGAPPRVVELRDAIRQADGLLIATPAARGRGRRRSGWRARHLRSRRSATELRGEQLLCEGVAIRPVADVRRTSAKRRGWEERSALSRDLETRTIAPRV